MELDGSFQEHFACLFVQEQGCLDNTILQLCHTLCEAGQVTAQNVAIEMTATLISQRACQSQWLKSGVGAWDSPRKNQP